MSKKMSLAEFQSASNWADAPMDEPSRPAPAARPPTDEDFPPLGAKPAPRAEPQYPTREERRPEKSYPSREDRTERSRDYERPRDERPREFDRPPRDERSRDYDRRDDREGGYRYRSDRERSYRPAYCSDERMNREPREPEPIPDSAPWKAFVANLSFHCTEDDLGNFFESNGCKVKDVHISTDLETGRSRGFGHVEFFDRSDLERALTLGGKVIREREIRVEVEKRRAPSPTQWRSSERKPIPPPFQRREIRDTAPPPAPIGNVSLKVPKKEKVHVNPFGAAKPVVTPIADVAARAPRSAPSDARRDSAHDEPRERRASPPRETRRPSPPRRTSPPREVKETSNRFAGLKVDDEEKQ